MPIRNKVREFRKDRGIKQLKMAEDLQVTRQTLTAIENSKYNPSLELALKLAQYFEVSVHEIFLLVEEDEK
jgi:putative transcriptional regulator